MRTQRILPLVFGTCTAAIAATYADTRQPVLNVLVSDQVGVGDDALRIAVDLAQQVLRQAGVPTNWIVCPPTQSGKVCPAETDRADVSIRILAKPAAGHQMQDTATGMALGASASIAFVYYDRVSSLANLGACAVYRLLGHVMAHEIGHLLGAEHCWGGIMHAQWNWNQVSQMRTGYLLFHTDQVPAIRQNARERIRLRR